MLDAFLPNAEGLRPKAYSVFKTEIKLRKETFVIHKNLWQLSKLSFRL